MTFAEYERLLAKLSKRQLLWLGHKARWEGCTKWAVLAGWEVPPTKALKRDGTNAR